MRKQLAVSAVMLAMLAPLALAQREQPERPRLAPPPTPEQYTERMLSRNDANGDGKIARDEMQGQFSDWLFENGDTNQDGFLDKAELGKLAEGFAERRRNPGEGGPPGAVTPGEPRQPLAAGQPIDFESAMSQAGRALRQLRRSSFDDASRQRDLELVQTLQTSLLAAKASAAEFPMAPQAKERYADDTVKYASDFRLKLIEVVMEALGLEAAVIEGDTAGAKESLEHLLAVQKEGHDAFQPEEDEEEAEEGDEAPPPTRGRPAQPGRAPGRGG